MNYKLSYADHLAIKAALTNNPGLVPVHKQHWFAGFKSDMAARGLDVDHATGMVILPKLVPVVAA